MNCHSVFYLLSGIACAACCCSCVTGTKPPVRQQSGETVVLIGQEPAFLAHVPAVHQPIRVRNTFRPGANSIDYVEGLDYVLDYSQGTICRTANSRLADFRTNNLYGQQEFDHSRFPGFGNNGFFAFIDYAYTESSAWPVQADQADFLKGTRAKLMAGQALKIVAYGDSITAGLDVPDPNNIFWNQWAEGLRRKYPAARITVLNGATGGDSTVQGLQRLQTKVLDQHPDLVLVGFGMNDHNKGGVPVPQFVENLCKIVDGIRVETSAEVILYSTFPPNPKWKYGSHQMADYAAATQRAAQLSRCAYADVFNNWQAVAVRKKPEDLLGNNINHPNEFGNWIYASVLSALGL